MNTEARGRLKRALQPVVERTGLRAYARSVRVAPSAVSKWLYGDSFPDGDNRESVAASLGMTLEQFNTVIVKGESSEMKDPVELIEQMIKVMPLPSVARIAQAAASRFSEVSEG